jgi:hypothetical protein
MNCNQKKLEDQGSEEKPSENRLDESEAQDEK